MQGKKLMYLVSSYEHNKFNFEGLGLNPEVYKILRKSEAHENLRYHLDTFKKSRGLRNQRKLTKSVRTIPVQSNNFLDNMKKR